MGKRGEEDILQESNPAPCFGQPEVVTVPERQSSDTQQSETAPGGGV